MTGYLLAYSSLMIAAGRLADVFGRVRLLRWGTVVYMAASVPAALATNPTILIAGLVGVGVGGAVLTPASLAIVTNSFRGASRGMAVGVWGGASALLSGDRPGDRRRLHPGGVLALDPVAERDRGGADPAGHARASESFDEEASHHIDVTGVALSGVGLGALTLAFNEAPTPWAFSSASFVLVLVAGVLLLVGFSVLERQLRSPLIDLAMFMRWNVSGSSVVIFRAELRLRREFCLPSAVPGGATRIRRAEGWSPAVAPERPVDDRDAARRATVRALRPCPAGRRRDGAGRRGDAAAEHRLAVDRLSRAVAAAGTARARRRHGAHSPELGRAERHAGPQSRHGEAILAMLAGLGGTFGVALGARCSSRFRPGRRPRRQPTAV